MIFSFNLHAIILALSTVVAFSLMAYTWKRRYMKSVYYFALLLAAVFIWSFFVTFEVASQVLPFTIIFSKFTYLGIVFLGPFFLLFALDYIGKDVQFSKHLWVKLLFLIPLISLIAVFTNELHYQYWQEHIIVATQPLLRTNNIYGWMFYLHTFYSYGCLAIGGIIFIKKLLVVNGAEKKRLLFIVLALLIPLAANFVTLLKIDFIIGIDLTPLAFVLTSLLLASSIFRYSLFESLPSIRAQIISYLDDGVIIINKNLKIIEVNKEAKNLFGNFLVKSNNAEDVFGKWPQITTAIRTKQNCKFELTQNQELNLRSFNVEIAHLNDETNSDSLILIIFRDISDIKRAEKGLEASEHKFAEVFEALPDGSFVVDKDGIVVFWNKAIEDITGITSEQVVGKDGYYLGNLIYKQSRFMFIHAVLFNDKEALDYYGEVKEEAGKFSGIIKVPDLNGKKDLVLWLSAKKIYDERGDVIGAIETVRDITEIRKIDEEYTATRSSLRAIVENTKDIIIYIDKNWQLLIFNQAFKEAVATLLHKEVKQGVDFHEYIFPGKESWWESNITQALNNNQFITELEYNLNGNKIFFEVAFNPVVMNKEVIGVSNFIKDITERKKSEQLLKDKLAELAKANEIMVGRELKMIELKKQILKTASGIETTIEQPPSY